MSLPVLDAYAGALVSNPVITKSVTSAVLFTASDIMAQRISPSDHGVNAKRSLATGLIGLVYFGPALHYYLEFITKLIPGTGIKATILKTLFGQLGFGPILTCIFFGSFLIIEEGFLKGLAKWPAKVKQDLLFVWASELCYWPFVDLIAYSLVPLQWIPLCYNVANFLWTIYLSLQAARSLRISDT